MTRGRQGLGLAKQGSRKAEGASYVILSSRVDLDSYEVLRRRRMLLAGALGSIRPSMTGDSSPAARR